MYFEWWGSVVIWGMDVATMTIVAIMTIIAIMTIRIALDRPSFKVKLGSVVEGMEADGGEDIGG